MIMRLKIIKNQNQNDFNIFCVFMVRFKELKDGIVTYRKNSIIIST